MAALIKLTLWDLNAKEEEREPIYVNPAHIMTVRLVQGRTVVSLTDGREIHVFDRPELVNAKIGDKKTAT